ncbi:MAG TPA: isochorismatase family protein [Caldilineae bacterium]|nr:isochorismatase family protein [Caldilineae bacterium]
MSIARIERSQIGLLLIDVQPAFLEYAFSGKDEQEESLLVRLEHFLMLADWMDLPLVATFEKPVSENGELPDRLEAVFPAKGQKFTKNYFGCMTEPDIAGAIKELQVEQIAVAGAETDVCVMQSVLGLLQAGYQVFLLEDCLFTSESQPAPALRRMVQAGAIPCTLKAMAYELVRCVDDLPWYPEGWEMKDRSHEKPFPKDFTSPEEWPAWEPKI